MIVLVTDIKALSVVATSVTTVCFVFLNFIYQIKNKIWYRINLVLNNRTKRTATRNLSLSFCTDR